MDSHDKVRSSEGGKNEIDRCGVMPSERRNGFYERRANGLLRRKAYGSKYSGQKHVVKYMAIIAFVALIAVASIALAPSGKKHATTPDIPADTQAPLQPFIVTGVTRDIAGTPLAFCNVNLTDKTTGAYNDTIVSNATGVYRVDAANNLTKGGPPGISTGNVMNITATKGALLGYNQTTVLAGPPRLNMDVTLKAVVIPEFGSLMLPLAGILSIFAIARVATTRKKT